MYRTVVTLCTTSLTFNNSTFCPHSVFMCFVWISKQTAIISLYNINWLVCITETECVYCAVRTGNSNTIQVNFILWRCNFVFNSCAGKLTELCKAHVPQDRGNVYSAHYIVSLAQPWNPMGSPCNVWAQARGPLDEVDHSLCLTWPVMFQLNSFI